MAKTYAWYYNGSAIGGATGKTHTLTSGQTDSNLIECRTQVDYGTDSVAALAEYGTSSAMAADTSALYWYAPDSVVESGGTVSAWNDKSGNGHHLGQVGTITLPTFVSGSPGYLDFGTSRDRIIGLTTFPYSASLRNARTNGGGNYGVFLVSQADWSAQSADTELGYVLLREGSGSDGFDGDIYENGCTHNTFIASSRATVRHYLRNTGGDELPVPSALDAGASTALKALNVVRFSYIAGTGIDGEINDAAYTNTSGTTAELPDTNDGLYIGGRSNSDTSVNSGWAGRVYEIFVTTDTSASNMDAIHSELLTKYGI